MTKKAPTILIDRREVARRIGVSLATLDRLRKEGGFPKPLQVGKAAKRWYAAEIEEWIESRELCAHYQHSVRFEIKTDLQAEARSDERPAELCTRWQASP